MADTFSKFAGIFPIERAASSKDAIPMSLEELAQADYAVEQAVKFGNYAPLVERLRAPGVKLLSLELDIAAGIIEGGGFKKPSHRTAQDPALLRSKRFYLAFSVLALIRKQGPPYKKAVKRAVGEVAEKNRVSISTVRTAVRENPDLFAGYL